MVTRTWRLTIKQGETLSRYFRLRDGSTGEVLDLSTIGVTSGTLTIRDEYGGEEIVTLNTDNGGVVIENGTKSNGWEYSGYIYMSAASTLALTDWADGVFDLEISDGIRDKVIASGVALLDPTTIT
jgi:hypothetical protein